MKLLVKDRKQLLRILDCLKRSRAYLMQPDTLVCRRKGMKTTTLDFTNEQNECCVSVDKEIGSELALLWTAIGSLCMALGVEDYNPRTR
jgi:hypothetical protein